MCPGPDAGGRAGDPPRGPGAGRGRGPGGAPHARRAARHAVAATALRRRTVSRLPYIPHNTRCP